MTLLVLRSYPLGWVMEQQPLVDRTRENIVILAAFMVTVITITVMTIIPGKKSVTIRPSVSAVRIEDIMLSRDNTTAPKRTVFDAQAVVQHWGTDPFLREEISTGAPAPEQAAVAEDLVLTMVLISGNQKTARINNRSYHEGDVVNGAKILSIEKDGVLVERKGVKTRLARKKRAVTLKQQSSTP